MRFLYVFPHPDDESFGPAPAMARQRREGHEVHLLTLTRGGATRQRHALGLSVDEMGEVRAKEMDAMAATLDLSSLEVLDFPDGGLAGIDPRELEDAIEARLVRLDPDVVVSYPVHGISGFADHLVAHAVVKRVVCVARDRSDGRRPRLAFATIAEAPDDGRRIPLSASSTEDIDCIVEASDADLERQRRGLDCYVTFREVIEELDPMAVQGRSVHFEIFAENHDPPLARLEDGLEERHHED